MTLPHYDYDHKFNYRKGYLRDDRVPAFISTAFNQIEKKVSLHPDDNDLKADVA
jgi:hypothetical protein